MASPFYPFALYVLLVLCGITACFFTVRRSAPLFCVLIIVGGAVIPVAIAYAFGYELGAGSNGGDKIAGDVFAFFRGLPGAFGWLVIGALAYASRTPTLSSKEPG
jgi:hypothetical protein